MTEAEKWKAVQGRDATADGRFVYSVRTTGVYCHPSCAARQPLRANVAFHPNGAAAEHAGFRACKRCRPDQPGLAARHAALVAAACRAIDAAMAEAEPAPDLETLARSAGMSLFHFHRVFRRVAGITPRAYGAARRGGAVRRELGGAGSVTEAIHAAGYGSSSRFYEKSSALLGMKPAAYRDGGRAAEIRFAIGQCSLGAVLVAATTKGVCAIEFDDSPEMLLERLGARFPKAVLLGGDAGFERMVARVVGEVETPCGALDLPLDIQGTAFQQRVWQKLREIPLGCTASYAEIASRIGMARAVRAVAGACAANSLAVAIPCHRVVRTGGELAGYRWGVARKRALLDREMLSRPIAPATAAPASPAAALKSTSCPKHYDAHLEDS